MSGLKLPDIKDSEHELRLSDDVDVVYLPCTVLLLAEQGWRSGGSLPPPCGDWVTPPERERLMFGVCIWIHGCYCPLSHG